MKKNSPESAFVRFRTFAALALCALGVCFAVMSFAATPSNGTLTDTSGPLSYTAGPFFQPNAFGNSIAGECDPDPSDPLLPCDVYQLHVSLPAGYVQAHPDQHLFVRIEWATPGAEFDLYLWDAKNWSGVTSFPSGSPLASSANSATTFQQVELPPDAAEHGEYVVQVSTTLPAGQSFTGTISLAAATAGHGTVKPPGNATGIAPRFQEYIPTETNGAPSAGLGLLAGEPTIGVNTKVNGDKGGDFFYQSLYEILRVRFDDSTSPAKAVWEFKDAPNGISNKATTDPIFLADPSTGRLWATQLAGGDSLTDISDDDGESWSPAISGGIGTGVDHQGMGVGPYPTSGPGSFIPHPLYPNALYYCSQQVATAFCARSDNGGQSYGPIVPIYDSATSRCVGLHGHPKVAPDGTVYVPNKGCGLDTPVIGQGLVNMVVSEDAGATWTIRAVPDSTGGLTSKGDPSVAIDKGGRVYLSFQNLNNNHLYVAMSDNKGQTFTPSVDVGALGGVNYSVFPAATAGDAGRAAVAFFGSPYNGTMTDYQSMNFPGVWYLYVATTYDGGQSWFVSNTTPDQPIQGAFGGISNGGDGRNHYDFIDAQIDTQGRIIASNSIGCAGACVNNGGPNTFAKLAGIVRQSGGRRLLSAFDPLEPAAPAAPLVTGYRTAQNVVLAWPEPDAAGSAISGYNVYRQIDDGTETKIAAGIPQRLFTDLAEPDKTYAYRVTSVSAQGESASSNVFAPKVGENAPQPELSCHLPGHVYADRVGEGAAYANNDIASFSIAEPENMPGKLVFVINNAHPELTSSANSEYYIFFDPPRGGLSYRLNLQTKQVEFYKNGQIDPACGTEGLDECRDWKPLGALDASSGVQADGSVWLVIDKATFDIKNGDVLLGISVREDTAQNPSTVLASDYAGGRQDYTVVGNDFCLLAASAPSPSPLPTATPSPIPAQLLNISTRLRVQTADNVMIGGFIVSGEGTKNVIVRALGPSLNVNGSPVAGRIDDPVVELHDNAGNIIATNNDWKETQQSAIEATGLQPSDDREAAIVQELPAGSYTAVMRGQNNSTGIGLMEVFDLDKSRRVQLANISTRGFVETGDNVMIGGFIAGPTVGRSETTIVVRALGPSLASAQVPNVLTDPTLEVHNENGDVVASNDDWATDANAAQVAAASLAPTDPRESALYMNVSPASLTAVVRGKDGEMGNALVEIYNLR